MFLIKDVCGQIVFVPEDDTFEFYNAWWEWICLTYCSFVSNPFKEGQALNWDTFWMYSCKRRWLHPSTDSGKIKQSLNQLNHFQLRQRGNKMLCVSLCSLSCHTEKFNWFNLCPFASLYTSGFSALILIWKLNVPPPITIRFFLFLPRLILI